MGSRRPEWLNLIPDNWSGEITNAEYFSQISAYCDLAIEVSQGLPDRLRNLVGRIDDLPPVSRDTLLAYLDSDAVGQLAECTRYPIWSELVAMSTKHRKFADADWALDEGALEKIDAIARHLAQQRPEICARHRCDS